MKKTTTKYVQVQAHVMIPYVIIADNFDNITLDMLFLHVCVLKF